MEALKASKRSEEHNKGQKKILTEDLTPNVLSISAYMLFKITLSSVDFYQGEQMQTGFHLTPLVTL